MEKHADVGRVSEICAVDSSWFHHSLTSQYLYEVESSSDLLLKYDFLK
jgi:hypothetical protein